MQTGGRGAAAARADRATRRGGPRTVGIRRAAVRADLRGVRGRRPPEARVSGQWGETRVVAPAFDPVPLAVAKAHLRIPAAYTAEDDQLALSLRSAVQWLEDATNRCLALSTWRFTFDRFPRGGRAQPIPRAPLRTLESITYRDGGDQETTISGAELDDLRVLTGLDPGEIAPRHGTIWPIALPQRGAVQFEVTCGPDEGELGDTERAAVLLMLGHYWETREESTAEALRCVPLGAKHLAQQIRRDWRRSYDPCQQ